MVDWKGLYNWTMKYNNVTKPTNLKQMPNEDIEFIQNSFESVWLNEMKEIWKILDIYKTPEGDTEKEKMNYIMKFCSKWVNINGPEKADNIVRYKRFNEIISYFFEIKHKK